MADVWAFVILLALYIGVCDGAICSKVSHYGYYPTTTYIYCSYGCCGSSYNRYCCTSSGTIAGIVIAVIAGVFILAFLVYLCFKKQNRPGRVIMPHSNMPHSNVTVVYAGMPGPSGYRGGPPVPPPYKAHDPPPPYAYGPNGGRQINTSAFPPGSYQGPSPAWQAPPPGPPPSNPNPPMPQPNIPPRAISSPAPPYSAPPGVPTNNDIHPLPGPLPPATAPVRTTQ